MATLVHDLALAVENAVMRHGKAIIDMQFVQERLANAAIDIFIATAALSRTTWEIERSGGEAGAQSQIDCARIFVPMAYRRARRNIRALTKNQDQRLKSIAELSHRQPGLRPGSPADVNRRRRTRAPTRYIHLDGGRLAGFMLRRPQCGTADERTRHHPPALAGAPGNLNLRSRARPRTWWRSRP